MRNKKTLLMVGAVIIIVIAGLWWWMSRSSENPGLSHLVQNISNVFGTSTTDFMLATSTATSTAAEGKGTATTPAKPTTVADIVASIGTASKFASWFQSTGVASSVSGKGPYTVFVPTNGAFTLVDQNEVTSLTAAERKRLVQYHVVVGRAIDPAAIESGNIQALSKDMLNFETRDADEIVRVNSSIIISSYPAKNGIVHVINNVLLPPKK